MKLLAILGPKFLVLCIYCHLCYQIPQVFYTSGCIQNTAKIQEEIQYFLSGIWSHALYCLFSGYQALMNSLPDLKLDTPDASVVSYKSCSVPFCFPSNMLTGYL